MITTRLLILTYDSVTLYCSSSAQQPSTDTRVDTGPVPRQSSILQRSTILPSADDRQPKVLMARDDSQQPSSSKPAARSPK